MTTTATRRVLFQLIVSLFVFSEINAQFQCSGRWAYICEGRRRALSNDVQVHDVRVSEDPVGDKSLNEDDDTPEWLVNLLAKSLRQTDGDDLNDVETESKLSKKSVDGSPASLSHPVELPRRATHERDSGVDEDDGLAAVRRQRLLALARQLAANDDLRRRDDDGLETRDRKYNGGYDQVSRKSATSNGERKFVEDFATKKRLLAKWLQEDRS